MQDRGLSWYDQNLNMQPRMAESWEINDDASEWTFHLRKGMSWSDGTPFTTEAIRWWWEEDETNTTISPSIGGTWVSGPDRTPMELEIVDDSTVTFKFPLPNPLCMSTDLAARHEIFTCPATILSSSTWS